MIIVPWKPDDAEGWVKYLIFTVGNADAFDFPSAQKLASRTVNNGACLYLDLRLLTFISRFKPNNSFIRDQCT